jgi:hypothetical protein
VDSSHETSQTPPPRATLEDLDNLPYLRTDFHGADTPSTVEIRAKGRSSRDEFWFGAVGEVNLMEVRGGVVRMLGDRRREEGMITTQRRQRVQRKQGKKRDLLTEDDRGDGCKSEQRDKAARTVVSTLHECVTLPGEDRGRGRGEQRWTASPQPK